MIILSIFLLILSISFFIISLIVCFKNKQLSKSNQEKLDKSIALEQNSALKENNAKYHEQAAEAKLAEAKKEISRAEKLTLKNIEEQKQIDSMLVKKQEELANIQFVIEEARKNSQHMKENFIKDSKEAAENYFNLLEEDYVQKEKEYKNKIDKIEAAVAQCQNDLDQIRDNRAAAMEALRKEKRIKEDKFQYSLQPSLDDLNDIKILSRIRNELKKPRILSMLIWQTYWQPIAKKKFVEILGKDTICGIYKITNQLTDECYIGQSVDVYKRWNDHCKCGLGIDASPGNKLYKAIDKYGLENFTFELLQKCNKEELDQQEKYFISLYEADKYGYNGNKGNK